MPDVLDIIALWGIREPFSALSHMAGALVSLWAVAALLRKALRAGVEGVALGEFALYGLSLVLVLTASGFNHLFMGPAERLARLNRLDHAAIFLLIGATATVVYGALHRRWAGGLITLIWAVTLGALWLHLNRWPLSTPLSTGLYLLAGWTPTLGLVGLIHAMGIRRLALFLGGGVIHTLGALMFALKWPVVWPGVIEGHEVFHVMVLLGVGMHYVFITRECLVPPPVRRRHRPARRPDRAPLPRATRPVGSGAPVE